MRPFYFGSSERPLFGVYHPPAGSASAAKGGVVFCYPFGREYLRAHRAVRELASSLARDGFHGLRFDYFGCGDSAGEDGDGSLPEWIANVGSALEELSETCRSSDLSIVGLRLGAALALLAAGSRRKPRFQRMVLWDPIVCGERYLEELVALQKVWAAAHPALESMEGSNGAVNLLGFSLTEALRDAIAGIDLRRFEGEAPAGSILIMTSGEDEQVLALGERLRSLGASVTWKTIPAAKFWLRQESVEQAVVPTETVRAISSWFTG